MSYVNDPKVRERKRRLNFTLTSAIFQSNFSRLDKHQLPYCFILQQMIFTKNQNDVVMGLLDGTFEVGFIRTNQIELSKDEDGNAIDPELFKIIDPKIFVMDNNDLFPFLHSTDIYPEWPLASLPHIQSDVVTEVQLALINMDLYANVGKGLEECTDKGYASCKDKKPTEFYEDAPCDTTWALAEVAWEASVAGSFAGFRSSRTYFELRTMQEAAGFLVQDEDDNWYCERPSNLHEGITCPEGFFRRNKEEFENGCGQVGLACDQNEDYDCFCKPCVKAFDVDVYQQEEGVEDLHLKAFYGDSYPGCEKMSICGTVEQGAIIKLRIYDNMQRENPEVKVVVHAGSEKRELPVEQIDAYGYDFVVTDKKVQVQVIDIFVNGKPISQSPIRVEVIDKDCDAIHGESSLREADAAGNCVCENNTYEMSGSCVESAYFFLIIFACVFVALGALVCFILSYKKQQSDSVWHVGVEEIHFNEPPEVIGQGAFGVVVLGQYRGTKVAVKRVLPPSRIPKHARGSVQCSGSVHLANEKKPEEPEKKDANKSVSFDSRSDFDPEAGNKSISASQSNKSWEQLLFNDSKYGNPLKLLETATLSNHGSDSYVAASAQSSRASQFMIGLLPQWMRFDEHSRLKREFVQEMRLLSRLRYVCASFLFPVPYFLGFILCNSISSKSNVYELLQASLYYYCHGGCHLPTCRSYVGKTIGVAKQATPCLRLLVSCLHCAVSLFGYQGDGIYGIRVAI